MEQGAWNYEVTWGFINVLNDVQYTIISLLVYDFLRLLLSEIKHFFFTIWKHLPFSGDDALILVLPFALAC